MSTDDPQHDTGLTPEQKAFILDQAMLADDPKVKAVEPLAREMREQLRGTNAEHEMLSSPHLAAAYKATATMPRKPLVIKTGRSVGKSTSLPSVQERIALRQPSLVKIDPRIVAVANAEINAQWQMAAERLASRETKA